MASIPSTEPDPRTVADDDEEPIGQGESSPDPVEGGNDEPGELPGSPRP